MVLFGLALGELVRLSCTWIGRCDSCVKRCVAFLVDLHSCGVLSSVFVFCDSPFLFLLLGGSAHVVACDVCVHSGSGWRHPIKVEFCETGEGIPTEAGHVNAQTGSRGDDIESLSANGAASLDDIDEELPPLRPYAFGQQKSTQSSALPAEELPSLVPDGLGQGERTTPPVNRTCAAEKSSGLDDLDGLEESDEELTDRPGHVLEGKPTSSSAAKTPATIKPSDLDDLDGLDDSDDELRGAEVGGAPQIKGLVTETRPIVSFQKMEMKPLRVSGAPAGPALLKSP